MNIREYIKKDDVKSIVEKIVTKENMSLNDKSFALQWDKDFEGDTVLRVRGSFNLNKEPLESDKLADMVSDIRYKIYKNYDDSPEDFSVSLWLSVHEKQKFKRRKHRVAA